MECSGWHCGGCGRRGGSEVRIADNAAFAAAPQQSAASTGQRPPLGEGTPAPLGGPVPVAIPWLQEEGRESGPCTCH